MSIIGRYILDEDHNIKLVETGDWIKFFEQRVEHPELWQVNRHIVHKSKLIESIPDKVRLELNPDEYAEISTVFLSVDHGFDPAQSPVLFETMVFGSSLDGEQDRCATWHEAELMHWKTVAKVLSLRS